MRNNEIYNAEVANELKEYGILNDDNSFTKKLTKQEVQSFLEGNVLVAENKNNRVLFQLKDNNSKLDVKFFQNNKSMKEVLSENDRDLKYIVEQRIPRPTDIKIGDTFNLKDNDPNDLLIITSIRPDESGNPIKIYFQDKKLEEFNIHYNDWLDRSANLSAEPRLKILSMNHNENTIRELDVIDHNKEVLDIFGKIKDPSVLHQFNAELSPILTSLEKKGNLFPNMIDDLALIDETSQFISNRLDKIEKAADLNVTSETVNIDDDMRLKVFVTDKTTGEITEYDTLSESEKILNIMEFADNEKVNLYELELRKLSSYLIDKIDKFPEIGKDILKDLNIVNNAINSVNSISQSNKTAEKQQQTKIELNVNDPDRYQDATREREENEQSEQETTERQRGFRR